MVKSRRTKKTTTKKPASMPTLPEAPPSVQVYEEYDDPQESVPELLPPPTSIDPLDPRFRAAWQEWTTSALGRLDQLPKLSQNQLAAIARAAAAGVGAGTGNQLALTGSSSDIGALTVQGNGQQVLGIDLPASLAALFEAKLTLDREKAKLVRMQKELQGYRVAAGRAKEYGPL
jgi:hypothetical protein